MCTLTVNNQIIPVVNTLWNLLQQYSMDIISTKIAISQLLRTMLTYALEKRGLL